MDETNSSLKHCVLLAILAVVIVAVSVWADLVSPGDHWSQRAGSIVTIFGAYVTYVDSTRSMKLIDRTLYIETRLPYKIMSVVLIVVGTLLWGYGDLCL